MFPREKKARLKLSNGRKEKRRPAHGVEVVNNECVKKSGGETKKTPWTLKGGRVHERT